MSKRSDAFRLPLFGWSPTVGDSVWLRRITPLKASSSAKVRDVLGLGMVRVDYESHNAWMSSKFLVDDVRPRRRLIPLLMSGPMVNALLCGFKTETRRPVRPQPEFVVGGSLSLAMGRGLRRENTCGTFDMVRKLAIKHCPYGQAGDLLYIREAWGLNWADAALVDPTFTFRADGRQVPIVPATRTWWTDWYTKHHPKPGKWQPSIFMPRWATRLVLQLESVDVEWSHDITEEAAMREGMGYFRHGYDVSSAATWAYLAWKQYKPDAKRFHQIVTRAGDAVHVFANVWEWLHGRGSWQHPTLVYVLRFRVWPLDVFTL